MSFYFIIKTFGSNQHSNPITGQVHNAFPYVLRVGKEFKLVITGKKYEHIRSLTKQHFFRKNLTKKSNKINDVTNRWRHTANNILYVPQQNKQKPDSGPEIRENARDPLMRRR